MNKKLCLLCVFLNLAAYSSVVGNEKKVLNNALTNNEISNEYQKLNDYLYVNYLPNHYNESLEIKFETAKPNYKVYYTLNGDMPEINNDYLYQKPIKLDRIVTNDLSDYPLTISVDGILEGDNEGKCVSDIYNNNIQRTDNYPMFQKQNVITVSVYDTSINEVVSSRSLTYLIDNQDYTIPVISLTMPYEEWFGEENGMYNKIREDIDKRVYLEYFDFQNDESFSLNSKIKLGGNWTLGYPMRTLNLNFNKDEFGNKNEKVKLPIFKDRVQRGNREERLTKLTRFRLHSGGNSFESSTGFNDAIAQALMEDSKVSTTGYRPCIGYLNGEYWGLYYIREHYSDTYFSDNYGVEKDDVNFYELKGNFLHDDGDQETGDVAIAELLDYVNNQDFTKYSVYKTFIDEYIDEESFIDLFIAEAYISNWDFVGNANNLKMWRVSKQEEGNPYTDGKWRFCMHDTDFSFTEYTNFLDKNVTNSYTSFKMFDNLLKQPEFREKFYNRAVELVENNFEPSKASRILNEMVAEVMPYKLDSMIRWGRNEQYFDYWLNDVDKTYDYFETKNRVFIATVQNSLKQYE